MANEEKYTVARGRLRLLDVALLLLILLTVLAAWQQSNLKYVFEGDHTQRAFAVSFEIINVPQEAAAALVADTALYTAADRGLVELGTLLDEPAVLPHITQMTGAAGTPPVSVIVQESSLYVDATGVFLCRGVLRDGMLVIGDIKLSVGDDIWVTTEKGKFHFSVLSISENR